MKKRIASLLALLLILCSLPALAGSQTDSIWLSPDQYYYQQLSQEHKAAWELIISNAIVYPEQNEARRSNYRLQALASMIKTDNPRIFWIDWIDSYGRLRYETSSEETLEPMQLPEGMMMLDLQVRFMTGIDIASYEIQFSLPADADIRTKARAVRDWLCSHNTYNDAQTSSHKKDHDPVIFDYQAAHSAYSAIIPGDAYEPVCEGYASAFKVLCDTIGVPCLCVNGSTSFAEAHMWNLVQLEDGKWYLVDVTGDDTNDTDYFFLKGASLAEEFSYTPNPYMNSGINPDSGYTEGAAFTVPEVAAD